MKNYWFPKKKWEKFAKANNQLYSEIYDVAPATIMHLFGSQHKKQIYENRLKNFMNYIMNAAPH